MRDSNKIIWIITLSGLMQFISSFNVNLMTVALPHIANDLHMTILMQNWINIGSVVITVGFGLPFTKILLKRGLNVSGRICVIILTILLLISTLSPNSIILLIARLLQGGPVGALYILGPILISLKVPVEKLGFALGILSASGYIGVTLAPFLSGLVIKWLSWRCVFLLLIPFLLINYIILLKLKDNWIINEDPIDNVGSILWFIGALGIIYGVSNIINMTGIIFLITGIILLIGFYFYEKRIFNPLFNVSLIKNRLFTVTSIMSAICSAITQSTPLIISYYLTYSLNLDVVLIGSILLILPIGQVIIAPITGKLSDKFDPKTISTIAFGFLTITMFLFTIIDKLPFYGIIIILLLQSLGYALCSPANNKIIITSVDNKDVNDANGFLSNIKSVGHVMGASLINIVFLIIIGNKSINSNNVSQLIEGIHINYWIFLILAIVGVLLGVYIRRSKNTNLQIL